MTEKPVTKGKKRRWLIVLLAALLFITLAVLDSRYRLTVTEYELPYANLPESFDGFKIVQLSDLHSKQFGKDNEKLLAKVRDENPDIIALTGDFINRSDFQKSEGQAKALRSFFTELSQIAPCYFVSGNHEWASGELNEFSVILEETGIKYLKNEYVFLEKDGERIILAGAEDPNGPKEQLSPDELAQGIRGVYPESFVVLLGHRDFWLEKYPELQVDLILAGHAHGGVVRLPFIGGIFGTDFQFFPQYDAGLYSEGGPDMVLSRGLGNYNLLPRFLNPPEIVSVTLRRG